MERGIMRGGTRVGDEQDVDEMADGMRLLLSGNSSRSDTWLAKLQQK